MYLLILIFVPFLSVIDLHADRSCWSMCGWSTRAIGPYLIKWYASIYRLSTKPWSQIFHFSSSAMVMCFIQLSTNSELLIIFCLKINYWLHCNYHNVVQTSIKRDTESNCSIAFLTTISSTNNIQNFGIIIDNRLTFPAHINIIVHKAFVRIKPLKFVR